MKKVILFLFAVFIGASAFAEKPLNMSSSQLMQENPEAYAEILKNTPINEITATTPALSWTDTKYAGFFMDTWNKKYYSPTFNPKSIFGDQTKLVKTIYYHISDKWPLDGWYVPQIEIYAYSPKGVFLGAITQLSGSGLRNVSDLNIPSNSQFIVMMAINGGGGPMIANPFIGNITITANY